jgi:hypothetical protein
VLVVPEFGVDPEFRPARACPVNVDPELLGVGAVPSVGEPNPVTAAGLEPGAVAIAPVDGGLVLPGVGAVGSEVGLIAP